MLTVAVTLPGCLGGGDEHTNLAYDASSSPEVRSDGGTTNPSGETPCHHDCFGDVRCDAGVLTRSGRGPIPCEYWKGSCPIIGTYACARGCRIDGVMPGTGEKLQLGCEEFRSKKLGDPCSTNEDCLPTPAVVTSPTTVENTYLRCVTSAGKCGAADPPVVPDYLGPCLLDLKSIPKTAVGYLDAPSCSGKLCLIAPNSDFTCLREGCTKSCDGDHQCPPGSVCVELEDVRPGDFGVYSLCKPGPPDVMGIGLLCRSAGDAGSEGG